MAKKEIGTDLPDIFLFEKDGDNLEGIYHKKKINVGENKANMYILIVGDKKLSVWGSTVLDDKMDEVKIGDLITITYLGKQKKKYHNYKLEVEVSETAEESKSDEEESSED